MFRPIDYNALDREFRPGKPLNTEIRRQIVDLYLSGEGPREISPTVRVTYGGVCRIIRHYQTRGTYFPLSRGGRRNLSKLSDNVLESIELFKLMKPISMFEREIRERLFERWRVRWEKLTGFIDCKQGNKDQGRNNKYSLKQRIHPSLFLISTSIELCISNLKIFFYISTKSP